jgi:hypothetical protein
MHIKEILDTVANAISRLDYGPIQDNKTNWMKFMKCWCHYNMHIESAESTYNHQEQIHLVFENCNEENVIYPLTVTEVTQAQKDDVVLKKLNKHDKYSSQLVEDTEVLCKEGKLSSPLLFKTRHSVGTTITCSTLDIQDMKKHFTPCCIRKV